jgi:acyl-CoA dehydrogenase
VGAARKCRRRRIPTAVAGLRDFDTNLFGHIGFAISNAVRSWVFGITTARSARHRATRTHALLPQAQPLLAEPGAVADTSMLLLGGKLEVQGKLSAASATCSASCTSASADAQALRGRGRPATEQPLLAYAFHDACTRSSWRCRARCATSRSARRPGCCGLLVFPLGRRAQAPSDRLGRRAAALLMSPSDARDRLAEGVFLTPCANNPAGRITATLPTVILAEPVGAQSSSRR